MLYILQERVRFTDWIKKWHEITGLKNIEFFYRTTYNHHLSVIEPGEECYVNLCESVCESMCESVCECVCQYVCVNMCVYESVCVSVCEYV